MGIIQSYDELSTLIPEVKRISNPSIQPKCLEAINKALEIGGWNKEQFIKAPILPVSVLENGPSKLEFLNEVIALCDDMYECVSDWILELAPCNRDVILTAAILSDIGNYVVQGPNPSAEVHMYNKAEWGAYIAAECQLPLAVVQILLTLDPRNSPEGAKAIFTNEGRFVRSSYFTLLSALTCA